MLWSVPVKANTQMGPLIDFAAVARVDRIVEDSASYGKVIVAADLSAMGR